MGQNYKSQIQALIEADEKRTQGEWKYSEIVERDDFGNPEGLCGVDVAVEDEGVICSLDCEQPRDGDWKETAKFIALSANLSGQIAKDLLTCIEALEKWKHFKDWQADYSGIATLHPIAEEALQKIGLGK